MHWSTEQSPSASDHRAAHRGATREWILQLGGRRRYGRTPPARALRGGPDSSTTRAIRLCGRSSAACPGSTPIDVSSTASGTDRSRSGTAVRARHRARRRVEHVAEARRFGVATAAAPRRRGRTSRHLAARAPLQHHHRQPGFLLELGVGEVVVAAERRRDRPPRTRTGVRAWAAAQRLRAAVA